MTPPFNLSKPQPLRETYNVLMPDDKIPPHVKAQADDVMQDSGIDRKQTGQSQKSFTEGQGADNAARLQVIKQAEIEQEQKAREQTQAQEQKPEQPEH